MKHITNFILLILNVLLLTMMACQKESITEPQAEATEQTQPGTSNEVGATDRGPVFGAKINTLGICLEGCTCANWIPTSTKRNAVSITVDPEIHKKYNENGNGLRYRFYQPSDPTAFFEIVCKSSTFYYASSLLYNNKVGYKVRISYGTYGTDYYFNTGKYNGRPCP